MSSFDTPKGCRCGECKRCKNRTRAAEWRKANKERVDAYNNDPGVAERRRQTSNAWKDRNKDRVREYRSDYQSRPEVKERRAEVCRITRQIPGIREKVRARETARDAIKRGKLVRDACESCGCPDTEAHHDDYSRPLDVTFLCRSCHMTLHESARQDSNLRPSA